MGFLQSFFEFGGINAEGCVVVGGKKIVDARDLWDSALLLMVVPSVLNQLLNPQALDVKLAYRVLVKVLGPQADKPVAWRRFSWLERTRPVRDWMQDFLADGLVFVLGARRSGCGPGAYPGLVKPFEPAELLDLVRHELGQEDWVSSRTRLGPFGRAKSVNKGRGDNSVTLTVTRWPTYGCLLRELRVRLLPSVFAHRIQTFDLREIEGPMKRVYGMKGFDAAHRRSGVAELREWVLMWESDDGHHRRRYKDKNIARNAAVAVAVPAINWNVLVLHDPRGAYPVQMQCWDCKGVARVMDRCTKCHRAICEKCFDPLSRRCLECSV